MHEHAKIDHATARLVETEQEKRLQIVVAHAGPDPRAMMIHLGRALSTRMAMPGPFWLPTATMRTCSRP